MIQRAVDGLEEGAQISLALSIGQRATGFREFAIHPMVVGSHCPCVFYHVHGDGLTRLADAKRSRSAAADERSEQGTRKRSLRAVRCIGRLGHGVRMSDGTVITCLRAWQRVS